MFTKKITYTDYDGNKRTEEFLFNLTKTELTMMQTSRLGGMEKRMRKIVAAQNQPEIMETFRDIILMSYGEKSDDGRRFIKTYPDGSKPCQAFQETPAYDQLFMELLSDEDAAMTFLRGIMPADIAAEIDKADKEALLNGDAETLLNA